MATTPRALVLLAVFLAGAAEPPPDSALWRALHGTLLGVARAGGRLVAVGDRGTILLSDDDGTRWTLASSGTDRLLTSVMFTDARNGWAVGQDATILRTLDAGAHWRVDHAAPGSDATLFSVALISAPAHLIATGAYASALETWDGVHWSDLKLPGLDEDYHFNCVVAWDGGAVILGEAGHAFLGDQGGWKPIPLPYAGSQFGCVNTASGEIISFGLRGLLFALPKGRIGWTRIDTGDTRALFGGRLLADGRLALVGAGGAILLFDPATGQARSLPAASGASLSGVAETSQHRLVVVGEDGLHVVDPAAGTVH